MSAVDEFQVYVGSLSYDTTVQDLKSHMQAAGEVLFAKIFESPDGRSKGAGIASFGSVAEAERAVAELNDTTLDGRQIFVREDQPKGMRKGKGEHRGKGGSKGRKGGGDDVGRRDSDSRVYVGNLGYDVTSEDVKDYFEQLGDVVHAEVLGESSGKGSKGCAIVEFKRHEGAQAAMAELNDTEMRGRKIFVREDRAPGDRAFGKSGGGKSGGGKRDDGGKSYGNSKGYGRKGERDAYDGGKSYGNSKGYGRKGERAANDGGKSYGNSKGYGRKGEQATSKVFVGNLSWTANEQELTDHMSTVGEVVHTQILYQSSGRSKGSAIVEYATEDSARQAVEQLHDAMFAERSLLLREFYP